MEIRLEALWFLLIGALLVAMALGRGLVARLPLSGAMVYLVVGFLIGPACANLLTVSLDGDVRTLRVVAETGLVVSLMAIGMRLRVPLSDPLWRLPLRLGFPAMFATVLLVAGSGILWGGLALGPALVLAAALAPTDPVLANELRVKEAGGDEPLRFALSGEGGCNDGSAYPFALVGLALCGWPSLGSERPATFLLAMLWGISGAAAIGWACGASMVRIVTWLRTRFGEAVGLEGFLAIGLMGLCYGAALLAHTYAFVAVFVAGVALRHEELDATGEQTPSEALADVERSHKHEAATSPELAHAYMAESMMAFAVEIERIVELGLMLLIGSIISAHWRELLDWHAIWPALFLLFIARPAGSVVALWGSTFDRQQRTLIAWLGIRGVGALYYLLFGLEHSRYATRPLAPVILATIVLSVFLHGCSATPALRRYMGRYMRTPACETGRKRKRTASATG